MDTPGCPAWAWDTPPALGDGAAGAGDTVGAGVADDEAVGAGLAEEEAVGVAEPEGWPMDGVVAVGDGVVSEGARVLFCPVPEIASPMDVPVPVLPQTADESGFPIAASAPVTQAMTKTKMPMASPP